jgi:hypothetical protein
MGFGFGGTTGRDGAFVMMNVPPGEYVLDVRPPRMAAPGTPVAEPEFASMPLTVGGEDITNLVVVTGYGAIASGRVIFEGGSQQTAAQGLSGPMSLRVMFASTDTNMLMMGRTMDSGVLEPDGQFELKGLTGKGTFRVMTPPQWTLKSVMLEGADITDTPYDIKSGANLSGLEITVTNTQSTVSGGVRTAAGEPAKDYVAVFFPANLREGEIPTRFIRSVRPDQEGKFVAKGLPPGDYFAIAVESLEQGGQWDPEFQERAKPRAKRFTLKEGQTLAFDLPLQP